MEGSQDDNPVDLQDNDFSFIPTQTSSAREMGSTKRKRKSMDTCEPITADSLLGAAMMLGEKLESIGEKISKSLGTELTLQQKIEQLDGFQAPILGGLFRSTIRKTVCAGSFTIPSSSSSLFPVSVLRSILMVMWSYPPTPKQLSLTLCGVAVGISFICAGAYLSYANIGPQQARAKARKDYLKARLRHLLKD
nr:uncharacterized protein At2g29880-like isoform X2 [Ipomoea batatas]